MSKHNTGMNPGLSTNAKAKIYMVALLAWLLVAWHLALVLCSDGLALTNVLAPLSALARLEPTVLGSGITTAPAMIVVGVWVLLIVLFIVAVSVGMASLARRRRLKKQGMVENEALDVRTKGAQKGAHAKDLLEPIAFYNGSPVRPRQEDTGAIVASPRMGKTMYLAVGMIIDAPAAVVATTTKFELVRLTALLRQDIGRVWVFDPEGISRWPDKLRWNVVDGCAEVKTAARRAKAMVAARPVDDGGKNNKFFEDAAVTVLRCFLHAAALGGFTMRDVLTWTRDFSDETPYRVLDNHEDAAPGWGHDLRKFCQGEARETVSSTEMSLSLVLAPLADPRVIEMVCPDDDGESFDPAEFIHSSDTLYLLSEGESGGAAPLVTALLETVIAEGKRASQFTRSGRLSPAITFVLDEVANVAPIPNLPSLMADGGGRGLSVWFFAQAFSQLEARYGRQGAETIWAAAAVKMLLGGSSDDAFLESVSRLLGERRITTANKHLDDDGDASSYSVSTELERKMPISDLREIPEGQALLMYREQPGAIVEIRPYWKRADVKQIRAAEEWCLEEEGITA